MRHPAYKALMPHNFDNREEKSLCGLVNWHEHHHVSENIEALFVATAHILPNRFNLPIDSGVIVINWLSTARPLVGVVVGAHAFGWWSVSALASFGAPALGFQFDPDSRGPA